MIKFNASGSSTCAPPLWQKMVLGSCGRGHRTFGGLLTAAPSTVTSPQTASICKPLLHNSYSNGDFYQSVQPRTAICLSVFSVSKKTSIVQVAGITVKVVKQIKSANRTILVRILHNPSNAGVGHSIPISNFDRRTIFMAYPLPY